MMPLPTYRQLVIRLLRFSLPLSAAGIVNTLGNVIVVLFVARLGRAPLAAAALAFQTFLPIMTVVNGSLYGVGILIGHQRGADRESAVGETVRNGLWFSLLLVIPSILLFWHGHQLLHLFRQDPAVVELTRGYFHYAALSLLTNALLMLVGQFYVGIGNARFSLVSTALRLPFLILLSYVLILGKWGFPQMGLAGVMAAAFYVQLAFCVVLLVYMGLHKEVKKYAVFAFPLLNVALLKKLIMLGLPIGLQFGSELAAIAIGVYFMGHFGVVPLATVQIISQYFVIVVMFVLGLSQGVSVLISTALGEKNIALIKRLQHASLGIIGATGFIALLVFTSVPTLLLSPFIDVHAQQNLPIVTLAKPLFIVAAVILWFDGLRNILSACLRGWHQSHYPMWVGMLSLWLITLPVGYWVGFHWYVGPIGLRIGASTGYIVATIILARRLFNITKSAELST